MHRPSGHSRGRPMVPASFQQSPAACHREHVARTVTRRPLHSPTSARCEPGPPRLPGRRAASSWLDHGGSATVDSRSGEARGRSIGRCPGRHADQLPGSHQPALRPGRAGGPQRPGSRADRSGPGTRTAMIGTTLSASGPGVDPAAHTAGSRPAWTCAHPGPSHARPVGRCWTTTTPAVPLQGSGCTLPHTASRLWTRAAPASARGPPRASDAATVPAHGRRRAPGSRRAHGGRQPDDRPRAR